MPRKLGRRRSVLQSTSGVRKGSHTCHQRSLWASASWRCVSGAGCGACPACPHRAPCPAARPFAAECFGFGAAVSPFQWLVTDGDAEEFLTSGLRPAALANSCICSNSF